VISAFDFHSIFIKLFELKKTILWQNLSFKISFHPDRFVTDVTRGFLFSPYKALGHVILPFYVQQFTVEKRRRKRWTFLLQTMINSYYDDSLESNGGILSWY